MGRLESEARKLAGDVMERALDGAIGAIEREAARRRAEACVEEIVAREVLRGLPRWRLIARGAWRRRMRLAHAQCLAQRAVDLRGVCQAVHEEYARAKDTQPIEVGRG